MMATSFGQQERQKPPKAKRRSPASEAIPNSDPTRRQYH